jgi:hypothetical protein
MANIAIPLIGLIVVMKEGFLSLEILVEDFLIVITQKDKMPKKIQQMAQGTCNHAGQITRHVVVNTVATYGKIALTIHKVVTFEDEQTLEPTKTQQATIKRSYAGTNNPPMAGQG